MKYAKIVVLLALVSLMTQSLILAQQPVSLTYGDVNGDGKITLSDVIYLVNYIFKPGWPPPNPVFIGDANGDNTVTLADVIYLVNYIFRGGPPPKNFVEEPDSNQIFIDSVSGTALVKGWVIVSFFDTVSLNSVEAIFAGIQAKKVGEARDSRVFAIEVSDTTSALAVLRNEPRVKIASQYYLGILLSPVNPNDSLYTGYQKDGFLLVRAPNAWGLTTGSSSVNILVLDDGVQKNHEDLSQNVNVVGDYVGWGHGTHVAGLIGANTNLINGVGVAGMTWDCTIFSVRVVEDLFGLTTYTDPLKVIAALEAAIKIGNLYNIKLIINMSFEVSFPCHFTDLIKKVWEKGHIMVAGAGNNGNKIDKHYPSIPLGCGDRAYPASFPEVLAVGAVDKYDGKVNNCDNMTSNWGSDVIAAPNFMGSTRPDNGYARSACDGTSFATPIVTGLAALIWAKNSTLTNAQVIDIIKNSADKNISATTDTFGLGRINAYRALLLADGTPIGENKFPDTVSWKSPSTVAGPSAVTVRWNSPSKNYDGSSFAGGDAINGYNIYRRKSVNPDGPWELLNSSGPLNQLYFVDRDIVPGTLNRYIVTAVDEIEQEGYGPSLFGQLVDTPPRIFFDDFSDGNDADWTKIHGNWSVENGEYSCNVPGDWATAGITNLNLANGIIEFDGTPQIGSPTPEITLVFRAADLTEFSNKYLLINFGWNNTGTALFRLVSGVYTQISPWKSESGQNGHTYHFYTKLNGNQITIYRDGDLLFNVTDSALSSGKVFLHSNDSHIHFDNVGASNPP